MLSSGINVIVICVKSNIKTFTSHWCVHGCACGCMWVHVGVCMCMWVYVCECGYMCVCACVCVCVCMLLFFSHGNISDADKT